MKRKNVFILLLVFLILLTPSCVLFVKAIATSPFPEREKIEEVSIRLDESGGKRSSTVRRSDILCPISERRCRRRAKSIARRT